jgi:PEP-CTERM motif
MKNLIIGSAILVAVGVLVLQSVEAQGTTTYLSNLGQSSAGSLAVGSDSWLAASFRTGANASGYSLNSIQLGMTDASGSPSDFTVTLYTSRLVAPAPGNSLGALNGSADPTTGGIYTYTPGSSLTLSGSTFYYIVLTAGTAVAAGAYDWSYAVTNSYNPDGGWSSSGGVVASSDNGSSWRQFIAVPAQFAINATAIPEPGVLGLLGLGGLAFLWHRRKAKTV